ncbi:MAG: hypothetical protein ACM3JG_11110 [Thiohalocapsa sp.]
MAEGSSEIRELLLGTWIGMALIAGAVSKSGALRRGALVDLLADAEALADDRRRVALSALRRLVEMELDKPARCPSPRSHRRADRV